MTAAQDWADEAEAVQDDDFLAFWRTHRAAAAEPATVRILGVDVVPPTDVPLAVADLAEQLQGSNDPADLGRIVAALFGDEVYAGWKAGGLTGQQLTVLLAWGMAHGMGRPVSFAQAAEMAKAAEEITAGKAQPALGIAPRASSTTGASARTGASSPRTSGASTRSRRRTSRG